MANVGTCQCGLVWSSDLDAVVANSDWVAASHNAWPAIAAELTALQRKDDEARDDYFTREELDREVPK